MGTRSSELATTAFALAGVSCLLISIGIYESQVTLMFFDKSIDVTIFVLATFLASLLAPLPMLGLGPKRATNVTTAVLGLATAVAALVRTENVELTASTVGVISGMWWFAIVVSADTGDPTGPNRLRTSVPIALGLVLVLRAAAHTMPLDELSLPIAVPIVAVLLIGLEWGAANVRVRGWTTADTRAALTLFALPFVFALASDVALNGAVAAGAAGLGLRATEMTGTYLGLLAGGIGLAAALLVDESRSAGRPIAVAAITLGATLLWTRIGLLPLAGAGLLAFGMVRSATLALAYPRRPARAPVRIPLAIGCGWVASAVASLAYYVGVGFLPALAAMVAVVAGAAVLSHPTVAPTSRRSSAVPAALCLVVPLLIVLTAPAPRLAAPTGALRVMTYNIHLGYDDGDVPSIDAIAAVIAASAPDLVALEEVSRGTVIAGGHDTLTLLAERLGMSYVFAPMLGDIEGVAILSRVPLDDVRVVRFARSTRRADLPRVALVVRAGGLTFAATHLGGDDFVTQVGSLIEGLRGEGHVIVGGDLNSVPDSPQMHLLAQAGFSDLGDAANEPTASAGEPTVRIDYLWARGVEARSFHTGHTTASDHLPIVADVTVR